ncbi:hypothetical protein JUNP479_3311 [Aeromonas jandaei]|nr:hypothetical protein JUNP479_3311 [Aeromonas jandaei]
MQGVDLLLQVGLQSQTGVQGALQQGNPIFEATGGHDGAVVAIKDNAAGIPPQIADRSRGVGRDCK